MAERAGERPPRGRIAYLLAALTAVPMLALVWSAAYVPTHDGPEHLAMISLARGLEAGRALHELHLAANRTIVLDLHAWMVGALWDPLGPIAAQKLFLSLYLVGMPVAACFVARALGVVGLLAALLASLLAPGWPFFMGFVNFVAALPLMLAAVGSWLRSDGGRRRGWTALSLVLLVATFLAHPFVLGVTGLVCGLIAWLRPDRSRWPALARLALIGALPAGLLVWDVLRARWAAAQGWLVTPTVWRSPLEVVQGLVYLTFGGPTRWTALLALPMALTLLWAVGVRGRGGEERPRARAVAWAAIFLFACDLVAPFHVSGWAFLQPRFGFIAWMLVATLAGVGLGRRRRRIVAGLALLAAMLAGLPFVHAYRRAASQVARFVDGAVAVPPEQLILPLVFEPRAGVADPYVAPMQLAGAYYAVESNGLTPYHFAVHPVAHPTLYKRRGATLPDYPSGHVWVDHEQVCTTRSFVWMDRTACRQARLALYGRLAFQMRSYGASAIWRPPQDFRRVLEERGYETLYDRYGTLVVRPRTGALRLAVAPPPEAGVLRARLWMPEQPDRAVGWLALPIETAGSAEFSRLPPGPYLLSVFLDVDGDGRFGGTDRRAEGVEAPGRYPLLIRHDQVLTVSIRWPAQPRSRETGSGTP